MTWDEIDAHQTGGLAEKVVLDLNAGFSTKLVASYHGIKESTVGYIIAHEEYGVLPKIVRQKAAADRIRTGEEFGRVRKLLNKIRRHIGHQARV